MATARRLTSQSGPFRIHRRHLYYPCTLCTLWLSLLIITIHLPRTLAQIEDIILDLEDPDDYVDEVVANLEREQADRERHQVEAAARCRVRCLAERQARQGGSGHKAAALDRCLRDDDCTACLKPCSQPIVNLAYCGDLCQNDASRGCEDSCLFLQNIYTQKPGQCPSIDQLTGYGALCIEACLVDSDCPEEDQKCCYNGCGHVCVIPSFDMIGVPLVPDQPQLSELRPEGAVLLEWNSVATNRTGPVLYIVWVRWNVGKHHSDAHMTHWQQITQTTDVTTIIKDTSPGHWYQYQLTAVNINGSRGSSPPTDVFSLSSEPASPGVPVNLTEGDTIVQGNHVTVSIHWKHPIISDLPITRYKIFWSKKVNKIPNSLDVTSQEERRVIPGDQMQFDIPDLEPESTYLAQIQAICQYGDARLKSDKASIYINTYPLSKAAQMVQTTTSVPVDIEPLVTPRPLVGVRIKEPFFQNGLLRANVSWSVVQDGSGSVVTKALLQWSPDACIADSELEDGLPQQLTTTTQNQYYVIYELRFDCRYVVHVMPISDYGAIGEESRATFVTPSCGEVTVVGNVLPDCPSSVPRVPEEPANLYHSFIINSVNISAHLAWDPPLSDSPVTGYRVTWGQTLPNNHNVVDKNTVLTKVLNKDASSFQLQSLCEAITYLFRIQALSRLGPGKVATTHFTTPVLTVTTPKHVPSSLGTSYEVLDIPPEPGENQVEELPNTSRPHSWRTNSGSLSASPLILLEVACVLLSVTLYYCKSLQESECHVGTFGHFSSRTHPFSGDKHLNVPYIDHVCDVIQLHNLACAADQSFELPER